MPLDTERPPWTEEIDPSQSGCTGFVPSHLEGMELFHPTVNCAWMHIEFPSSKINSVRICTMQNLDPLVDADPP